MVLTIQETREIKWSDGKKFDDQMVNFFIHLNQKLSALNIAVTSRCGRSHHRWDDDVAPGFPFNRCQIDYSKTFLQLNFIDCCVDCWTHHKGTFDEKSKLIELTFWLFREWFPRKKKVVAQPFIVTAVAKNGLQNISDKKYANNLQIFDIWLFVV